MNILRNPQLQAIIKVTFNRLDEVTDFMKEEVRNLTVRISQVENKLTALGNKVRNLKNTKSSQNTTKAKKNSPKIRAGMIPDEKNPIS